MSDHANTTEGPADERGRAGRRSQRRGATESRHVSEGEINQSDQMDGKVGPEGDGPSLLSASEFDFKGRTVRTVTRDGETWFVAADICAVLQHSNPTRAVERLDDDERGLTTIQAHPGNDQIVNVVSESGLYALIFSSRKPEAKVFRRWVTGVVIPSIRRTGAYRLDGTGQSEPKRLGWTVGIPGRGRFVVHARSSGDVRVHETSGTEAKAEFTALDCQIMACACLQIGNLWQRVQELRAAGRDPSDGFAFEQLDQAILSGARIGRQYFYSHDKPDQPPADNLGRPGTPPAG